MLIFGRNLSLGWETTDICATVRPKLHIVRRNHCYVRLNPAEISYRTKKQKIFTLISVRFLAMEGETTDMFAKKSGRNLPPPTGLTAEISNFRLYGLNWILKI